MNSDWDPSMAKFQSDDDVYILTNKQKNAVISRILPRVFPLNNTRENIGLDINNNQTEFKNVLQLILKETLTSEFQKRREEMMSMLQDPKTGEEVYLDLSMAERYEFDDNKAYSLEHGSPLRIVTRFEEASANNVLLAVRLFNKTQEIAYKFWEFTKESLEQILYDLVYVKKEYDMMAHSEMKSVHDQLLTNLIKGHNAFLDDMKTIKGIGMSYDNNNMIINFFNSASLTMKSAHIQKDQDIISINDSDVTTLNCIFYSPEYKDHIIFFKEGQKASFKNIESLPVEIQAAIPILKSQDSLNYSESMNENRQYFYDKIINPIREVSRKQSIASEFSDIDFDF